jgi:hypothetical protein
VVLVQGPPGVGKSTLVRDLVRHYCRQALGEVRGPVTVVAGKARRITFVECPPDLAGMMDAAKYADLVLLLIDGSFGFEMETFEFLNLLQVGAGQVGWAGLGGPPAEPRGTPWAAAARAAAPSPRLLPTPCCQRVTPAAPPASVAAPLALPQRASCLSPLSPAPTPNKKHHHRHCHRHCHRHPTPSLAAQVHGFPRVIGVLTHLDSFQDQSKLRATKKALKARFWTEIYDGAKLFYLSGARRRLPLGDAGALRLKGCWTGLQPPRRPAPAPPHGQRCRRLCRAQRPRRPTARRHPVRQVPQARDPQPGALHQREQAAPADLAPGPPLPHR